MRARQVQASRSILLEVFTTREIASGAWFAVLTIWALSQRTIRRAFLEVLRSFKNWKISLPLLLLAGYTGFVVWGLSAVDVWTSSLLKDTVVWLFSAGVISTFRFVTGDGDAQIKQLIVDNLQIIVVLEFIAVTYTFSLPVELILVPLSAILVMMHTVAEAKEEYASVARVTGVLLTVLGFAIMGSAIVKASVDYASLGSPETLRAFFLPIILSLSSIPFVYTLGLIASYELMFIRLTMGPEMAKSDRPYAWIQLIRHVGWSRRNAQRFLSNHAGSLMRAESRSDIDQLIASDGL